LDIINSRENIMPTVVANDDGSYTITVPAPAAPVNTVSPEVTEVDLVLTDGSTKKFTAAA
jgi:hypothetical protein